jgi:hypothetical protein
MAKSFYGPSALLYDPAWTAARRYRTERVPLGLCSFTDNTPIVNELVPESLLQLLDQRDTAVHQRDAAMQALHPSQAAFLPAGQSSSDPALAMYTPAPRQYVVDSVPSAQEPFTHSSSSVLAPSAGAAPVGDRTHPVHRATISSMNFHSGGTSTNQAPPFARARAIAPSYTLPSLANLSTQADSAAGPAGPLSPFVLGVRSYRHSVDGILEPKPSEFTQRAICDCWPWFREKGAN